MLDAAKEDEVCEIYLLEKHALMHFRVFHGCKEPGLELPG